MWQHSGCRIDMSNGDADGSTLHSWLHVYYGDQEELRKAYTFAPVARCCTHMNVLV